MMKRDQEILHAQKEAGNPMATTMLAALQTIQKEVDSSLKYKKVYKHVIWKIKYDHRIDLKTLKDVIFDSIRQELGQDKL